MAESKSNVSYPGHDEGTQKPSKAPDGYNSPAAHAPLSDTATSVNVKTPSGHKGGKD